MFKLPFALINLVCGSSVRQYSWTFIFQCVYVCMCKLKRGQIIFRADFSMVSYVVIGTQGSAKLLVRFSGRKQSKHNVTNPYWLPDASKYSRLAGNYCFLWSIPTLPFWCFSLWCPVTLLRMWCLLLSACTDRWTVVPARDLNSQSTRLSLVVPQKADNWLAKANGFWQVLN